LGLTVLSQLPSRPITLVLIVVFVVSKTRAVKKK